MAFTVPSSWESLNQTAPVAIDETIVAGNNTGAEHHMSALVVNDRRTRAVTFAALSPGDDDGIDTQISNAGAASGWAEVGTLRLELRSGASGTLDLVAWIKAMRSGGGLYVAALTTAGSLVTSTTLSNTGASKEEVTGSLTGLSAGTTYLIEVRGAGDGTNIGVFYGLEVRQEEQDASTLG